jgi:hypothetical protein
MRLYTCFEQAKSFGKRGDLFGKQYYQMNAWGAMELVKGIFQGFGTFIRAGMYTYSRPEALDGPSRQPPPAVNLGTGRFVELPDEGTLWFEYKMWGGEVCYAYEPGNLTIESEGLLYRRRRSGKIAFKNQDVRDLLTRGWGK